MPTGTAMSMAMSAGDQGAVDRRQRAEMFAGRAPGLGGDEAEAEGLEGRHGADHQRDDHAGEDRSTSSAASQREQTEARVARAGPAGGLGSGGKGGSVRSS